VGLGSNRDHNALTMLRNFHRIGAQGRNRTTDTVIFSHVLYQLSYLGGRRRNAGAVETSRAYRRPRRALSSAAYSGGIARARTTHRACEFVTGRVGRNGGPAFPRGMTLHVFSPDDLATARERTARTAPSICRTRNPNASSRDL
jgi:hypothetical protein